MTAERYTVDEFGDLFGLTADERIAVETTLLSARSSGLRHPDDLLTDEQRDELHAHLERMARSRRRPSTWASTRSIG